MIKRVIFLAVAIFLFSGCSFKMPSFLTFGSSNDGNKQILEEANKCQNFESENNKLHCYKRVETSNSFAQLRLGTYYADKKDYKKALYYLNKAKEGDNIYANLPLSSIYYKGEGVEKDLDKSFELLKETSNLDPVAAHQLSKFYLQGINTRVDYEKGVELLEFAGEKGVLQAQEMLANIYKNGLFKQPKDQVKFEYWLKKTKENKEDENNYKIYRL